MDYLELRFAEILQYKVEKRIYFELIATSTSRDELGKLSGQRGQGRVKSTGKPDFGLFEIKLQLLTLKKEHNQFGIKFPTAYITGIIKVLYLRYLNLKLQGPKLEKCRSYRTKRFINYKDALRPILTLGSIVRLLARLPGYACLYLLQTLAILQFKIKNTSFP